MADTTKTDFRLSFPDLITKCNTVHSFMQRDAAEFLANFGVTALSISSFETKINEFESFPTDEELLGAAQQKTQNKDTIANDLRIKIRSVALRAKAVFGENSGNYNAFGVKDMNNFDDGNLLNCGRRVVRMGTSFLTELTPEGLTQDILDELTDTCNNLEDAIDEQQLAFGNRKDSTKNRLDKANELYNLLVKYCDYGKNIWYNTNPARYSDYVIYTETSPGSLTSPVNIQYTPETSQISWQEVINATSYQIQHKQHSSSEWSVLWEGSNTYFISSDAPGNYDIRIRARNAGGFGPFSSVYNYTVINV